MHMYALVWLSTKMHHTRCMNISRKHISSSTPTSVFFSERCCFHIFFCVFPTMWLLVLPSLGAVVLDGVVIEHTHPQNTLKHTHPTNEGAGAHFFANTTTPPQPNRTRPSVAADAITIFIRHTPYAHTLTQGWSHIYLWAAAGMCESLVEPLSKDTKTARWRRFKPSYAHEKKIADGGSVSLTTHGHRRDVTKMGLDGTVFFLYAMYTNLCAHFGGIQWHEFVFLCATRLHKHICAMHGWVWQIRHLFSVLGCAKAAIDFSKLEMCSPMLI